MPTYVVGRSGRSQSVSRYLNGIVKVNAVPTGWPVQVYDDVAFYDSDRLLTTLSAVGRTIARWKGSPDPCDVKYTHTAPISECANDRLLCSIASQLFREWEAG